LKNDVLAAIEGGGDHYALLIVIKDVLDFSKIEAGRLDLDPNLFNFREHLVQTLELLALRAQQKGLKLTSDI